MAPNEAKINEESVLNVLKEIKQLLDKTPLNDYERLIVLKDAAAHQENVNNAKLTAYATLAAIHKLS
ncbi:hypothetical protein [uncultured Paraglaciecola sp.]|uniref:hypothetical protein n=1 Tax=uncultured Paraglaciecola sp. TaxID=1765024 RepID=UPI00262F0F11|nr:hypothetical protein [uncultured Paraglaciecola sp.]